MDNDKEAEGDEPFHELEEPDLPITAARRGAVAEEAKEGGLGVDERAGCGAEDGNGNGHESLEEAQIERVRPEGHKGPLDLA